MKVNGTAIWKTIWVLIGITLPLFPISAKELAKVNESSITDKDLVLALSSLNEGQRDNVLKDVNSRRQLLFEIIDREVLAQEGEKLKLDQEPGFKAQMVLFRKQLLMSRLLEKKFSSQLTESAAKKYFQAHKDKFSTDQAHIQQILLGDEAQAKKVLALAQDSKNDFQELAEKYSKDPSAKNNRGDLGFIGRNRFVPEFTEAAFATPVGEITGPIKTIYGYHIVKVIDKRLGKSLGFDEVELQVRNALRQDLVRNYVDSLKGQSKIKVDNVALEKY